MKTHTLSTRKSASQTSPRIRITRPTAYNTILRDVLQRWSRRILLVALMLISLSAAAAFIGCDGRSSVRTSISHSIPNPIHNPAATSVLVKATFPLKSKNA